MESTSRLHAPLHSRTYRALLAVRGNLVADLLRDKFAHRLPKGVQLRFDRRRELTWYQGGPGTTLKAYLSCNMELRVFLDESKLLLHFAEDNRQKMLSHAFIELSADSYEALLGRANNEIRLAMRHRMMIAA